MDEGDNVPCMPKFLTTLKQLDAWKIERKELWGRQPSFQPAYNRCLTLSGNSSLSIRADGCDSKLPVDYSVHHSNFVAMSACLQKKDCVRDSLEAGLNPPHFKFLLYA